MRPRLCWPTDGWQVIATCSADSAVYLSAPGCPPRRIIADRSLIATHRRYEITARTETLPHMILHLLPKRPGQVECAFALDEIHNRRHGIRRRNRNCHVHKDDRWTTANSLAKTAQPIRAKERRIVEGLVPMRTGPVWLHPRPGADTTHSEILSVAMRRMERNNEPAISDGGMLCRHWNP